MPRRRLALLAAAVTTFTAGGAFAQDAPPPAPPAEPPAAAQPAAPAAPVAAPVAAPAATPAAAPAGDDCYFSKLEIHGGVDFMGIGSFQNPLAGAGNLKIRVFDNTNAGGIQLNQAKVSIAHAIDPFGFRIDLHAGNAANAIAALDPSSGNVGMTGHHGSAASWAQTIEQAYLSYKIDVMKGLTLDAGRFVTHMGFEVVESRDNWNYSRSILFGWAIPFHHTGLRATLQASDTLAIGLYWLNGWNAFVTDGSDMQTAGFQLNWTATPQLQAIVNFVGGKINAALPGVNAYVGDLIAIYKPTDALSLALNVDIGYATAGGGSGTYMGLAAYGRYQVTPWLASGLRFEYFGDNDGFATGTAPAGQKLWEVTLTLAELTHVFGPANMNMRIEYRHDQSDIAYFLDDTGAPTQKQDTITVGTIAYF